MGYRKVLVTLDGSKLAEQALQHVLRIVDPGANIHLLSVMAKDPTTEKAALISAARQPNTAESDWPPLRPANPAATDARYQYLKTVADWMEQMEYNVSTEVRTSDDVIGTIVEVGQDKFDIVVMATHGRSSSERTVVSSVTQGVLERLACPVLIVSTTKEKKSTKKGKESPSNGQ